MGGISHCGQRGSTEGRTAVHGGRPTRQDEAAESGAVELARVRNELERRHADELQHARRTVVEAFEALASSFPPREDGEAKPDPTGPSSATESDENAA